MIRFLVATLTLLAVTLPMLSQAKEGSDWFAALKDAQSANDCDDGLRHLGVGRQEYKNAIENIKRIDGKDLCRSDQLDRKVGKFRLGAMMIGFIIEWGKCERYDRSRAIDLFREAAALGGESARILLAKYYLKGHRGSPDEAKARYWLKSVALASISYPESDPSENVTRFIVDERVKNMLLEELAWVRGLLAQAPKIRMSVAHKLRDGVGVPRDRLSAYYWLDNAADDGLIEAKYELADWVIENRFPWQFLSFKANILGSAANAGYVKAMLDLARRRETGDGVFKSPYSAYYWLLRARLYGAEVAAAIDRVSPQLSEKARSRAHLMAYKPFN